MGGGGGDSATTLSLEYTPTWALATVCFVFISFGLFIEHLIHLLCHWLKKHRKTSLFEAVEKLKSVLMLLGFMSLILAVTQRYIAKICVPNGVAYSMLPCRKYTESKTTKLLEHLWISFRNSSPSTKGAVISRHERRLDSDIDESSDYCTSKGLTSFMSEAGIGQLNNFIFVLAIMQIVYSFVTMALGRAKMRHWKAWERETQTIEYLAANDPSRFRFTRQTTFGKRHMENCTTTPLQLWIKCFFRQFFNSVAKVDYLTLRHGFISTHLSTNNNFNFQKYIQRSLEDDFKVVVGISPFMWLMVVIFLLVDVHGWNVYLWVSFLPLIIVLLIGTKLEVIVARMALQLKDENTVTKGTPLVQPNDSLFWFSRPQLFLTLLHYTLFMNAFELAFFIWVTLQFGIHSCYHEHAEVIVVRVVLTVMVQVICSYITLPLYALVTQMGSNFKSAVLEEETLHVIKQWHAGVRDKKKRKRGREESERQSPTRLDLYNNYQSSTTTACNSTSNSPDVSSHYRNPSLADYFSHAGNEITEIHSAASDDNGDHRPPQDSADHVDSTVSNVNVMQIEIKS